LLSSEKAGSKRLVLFNYAHLVISSKEKALQQKNAVFGSIFSLKKLFSVCGDYGLTFDHSIILVLGQKVARLIGTQKRQSPMLHREDAQVNTTPATEEDTGHDEKYRDDRALELLPCEKEALSKELKDTIKARNDYLLKAEIKSLKSQWDRSSEWIYNRHIYQAIQESKEARDTLVYRVHQLQVALGDIKVKIYRYR
jgi:hypothetical protein